MEIAALGFVALFALLFLGIPIGFAMAAVGVVGVAAIIGWGPSLDTAALVVTSTVQTYEFTVIPLFVLMGNFITRANLAEELYEASYAYLGHRRGGLAMATIVACTGFSAVCGSSMATAATMSKVAMPPMKRFGYHDSLAAGSVAAGGTLGILVPPSAALILYAIMASQNIEAMFIAGILPGILGMLCYMGAVFAVTLRNPALGPGGERSSAAFRRQALLRVWEVLALFLAVLGGLYAGIFSATEAAGIGAAGGFLVALKRRTLTLRGFFDVLVESARTTGMLFVILIGALIFVNLINLGRVPNELGAWLQGMEVAPIVVVLAIIGIYLILGCVMESISMMLLTVPVFFPVVSAMGVDPIWFGIIVVVAIEISLITPPVGLNVFVLNAVLPDTRLTEIYKGVLPFVVADLIRLAILLAFPAIALTLPNMMAG